MIRKKHVKSPAPKTRKGRKSEVLLLQRKGPEQDLEGVNELFKTPSKSILSSLKSSSSIKKTKSKVRFSLQNDVQSPSGRRSSVKLSDDPTFFGSPIVHSKRYVGTPRQGRISELSLMHTSILEEESPLAEDINYSQTSHSKRRPSSSSLKRQSTQSFDFSVYSPSSPTLQISNISSSHEDQSFNKSQASPYSEKNNESPDCNRSLPLSNSSTQSQSSNRRFSRARRSVNSSKDSHVMLSPTISYHTNTSNNDLSLHTPDDSTIFTTSTRNVSRDSIDNSGEYNLSLNSLEGSRRSSRKSLVSDNSVSQIPLPPGSPKVKGNKSLSSIIVPSSQASTCFTRLTKSYLNTSLESFTPTPTKSVSRRRSKSKDVDLLHSNSKSLITPQVEGDSTNCESFPLHSSLISQKNNTSDGPIEISDISGRVSSTPKSKAATNIRSPINSPIARMSIKNVTNENETEHVKDDETLKLSNEVSLTLSLDTGIFETPTTMSGRKSKRGSARMSASNINVATPESQVPIATVRPSTRKKLGNESVSSVGESISLPSFSLSHDVSERSLDTNLCQKMFDSRLYSCTQFSENVSTAISPHNKSNVSVGSESSTRRKRKSSGSSFKSPEAYSFDFNNAITPKVPKEIFVSPLSNVENSLSSTLKGVKRIFNPKEGSPISSYVDVKGVKRLLKTPQPPPPAANYTKVEGIKNLFKQSPSPDYTNVTGIKRIYGVQHEPNYMNVKGVRRIFKDTKMPNSPDVSGVEVLFESPKKSQDQTYPKPFVKVLPMTILNSNKIVDENETFELVEPITSRNVDSSTNLNSRHSQVSAVDSISSNENTEVSYGSVGLRKTRRKAAKELNSQEKINNHINTQTNLEIDSDKSVKLTKVKRTHSNNTNTTLAPVDQSPKLENKRGRKRKQPKTKAEHSLDQETNTTDALGKRKSATSLSDTNENAPSPPKRTRRGKQLILVETVEELNDRDIPVKQIRRRGQAAVNLTQKKENISPTKSLNTEELLTTKVKGKSENPKDDNVKNKDNIKLNEKSKKENESESEVSLKTNKITKKEVVGRSRTRTAKNQGIENVEIISDSINPPFPKRLKQNGLDSELYNKNEAEKLSEPIIDEANTQINHQIELLHNSVKKSTRSKKNQLPQMESCLKTESQITSRGRGIKKQTQQSNEETLALDSVKSTIRSKRNQQSEKTNSESFPKTQEINLTLDTPKPHTHSNKSQQSETDLESCTKSESETSSRPVRKGKKVKSQTQVNSKESSELETGKSTRSKRNQQDKTELVSFSNTEPETLKKSRSRTVKMNLQSENDLDSVTKSEPQTSSRSRSKTVKNHNEVSSEDSSGLTTNTRSKKDQQLKTTFDRIEQLEDSSKSRNKQLKNSSEPQTKLEEEKKTRRKIVAETLKDSTEKKSCGRKKIKNCVKLEDGTLENSTTESDMSPNNESPMKRETRRVQFSG